MAIRDEVESYLAGETDAFTVSLVVKDRSDPEISSWTVEVTTRDMPGPGGSLVKSTHSMPAQSAFELAPLLIKAEALLSGLIEGHTDSPPDFPPE
jgi:hypothetical protein